MILFHLWPLDPQAAAGGRRSSLPISAPWPRKRQLLWKETDLTGQASFRPPVLDSSELVPVSDALGHPHRLTNKLVPPAAGWACGWLGVLETGAGCLPGAPPRVRGGRRPSLHVSRSTTWPCATFFKPAVTVPVVLLCSCGFPAPCPRTVCQVLCWVPGGQQGIGGSGSAGGDEQCFGCGAAEP